MKVLPELYIDTIGAQDPVYTFRHVYQGPYKGPIFSGQNFPKPTINTYLPDQQYEVMGSYDRVHNTTDLDISNKIRFF